MIRLEPVNDNTFKKVINMKLPPEQSCFVAQNVVSLAQAWLYHEMARPLAICNDDDVVGFIMLDWDEGERAVGIWRFMIATEHQHKGYGRKAMEAAIKLVQAAGKFDLMHLSYVPDNTIARDLYYSLGFRENGDVDDDEIIMTLPLTDDPKVGMLTADEEDMDDFIALIKSEEQSGTYILAEFQNVDFLEKAVAEGCVKRLTLMGETIGLAIGDQLLIERKSLSYLAEAQAKLKGSRQ